mgnify:FL=1
MTKRKKQALYILGISIPSLGLGVWGFEIGGGGGAVGLITAIGITFGVTGSISGLTMLFTKNRLGWFDSEPFDFKPIFIKKEKTEMPKIKKEEPINKHASESIQLMKREENLVKRSDELNNLIVEADNELHQVRCDLEAKGWIQSADGWVIG